MTKFQFYSNLYVMFYAFYFFALKFIYSCAKW